MNSYLVYSFFPLTGVVGAVCFSGEQSSRCQWIQGSDGSSSWYSQGHGSGHPVGHSAFLEVTGCSQGLQDQWLQDTEIASLGFFLLRVLPWACSGRGRGSGLLPWRFRIHAPGLQMSLVLAYSLRDSYLNPQKSLVPDYSLRGPRLAPRPAEILAQAYSLADHRGLWFWPIPSVVAPLYLFLWSLLSQACPDIGS